MPVLPSAQTAGIAEYNLEKSARGLGPLHCIAMDADTVDERQNWWPVDADFTTFVREHTNCPACTIAQHANGGKRRFYVRRTGDLLMIAQADDLHQPEGHIIARLILDLADQSVFQVLSQHPKGAASAGVGAGVGVIFLSRLQRRRQLKFIGVKNASGCPNDAFLMAVEFED